MANWACCDYWFYGDEGQVARLKKDMDSAYAEPDSCLSHLYKINGSEEGDSWRGEITYVYMNGDTLEVTTSEAWCAYVNSMQTLIDRYYPGVHMECRCEEEGCDVFFHYSDDGSFRYKRDAYVMYQDDWDPVYFKDAEEAAEYIKENVMPYINPDKKQQQLVKNNEEGVLEVINKWNEIMAGDEGYKSFHCYDECTRRELDEFQ